jgi:hypothetical protein
MRELELDVVAAPSPQSGSAPPGELVADGNGSAQPVEVFDADADEPHAEA